MRFCDKLEVLIARKGYSKADFAREVGITYRALANYLSGERLPKDKVFEKISQVLSEDPAFLRSEAKSLELSSEERFLYTKKLDTKPFGRAQSLFRDAKEIFAGKMFTPENKQEIFTVLTEIYFHEKNKHNKPNSAV